MDHAHRESQVLGVGGALEVAVADREVLVAVALEAEVGVLGTPAGRALQSDLTQLSVGECWEGGIKARRAHGPEPNPSAGRVASMTAPAWLGIGAQRSGTTWFTDLLCQHPQVGLGTNGKKEQHLLHKVGDGVEDAATYLDLFPSDGVARGEWTPQYLRHSSAPFAAARMLGAEAPVLAILRDPVERFLSAMRLAATRAKSPWPYPVPITVQTFSGFYADQLAMWANAVGRERMVVMVYEEVRRDPQRAVDAVWGRLGRSRSGWSTSTGPPGRAAARAGSHPQVWWSRCRCSTARSSRDWPSSGTWT